MRENSAASGGVLRMEGEVSASVIPEDVTANRHASESFRMEVRVMRARTRGIIRHSAGPSSRGWSCTPSRAAATVSGALRRSATREAGFPAGSSCRKGTKK